MRKKIQQRLSHKRKRTSYFSKKNKKRGSLGNICLGQCSFNLLTLTCVSMQMSYQLIIFYAKYMRRMHGQKLTQIMLCQHRFAGIAPHMLQVLGLP